MTISLCMIVKNEENTLPRCLASVEGAVDEIIVVDTGSSDGTKDAARRFTDKVYDFAWTDDFSQARNFSFEKATMDYIFWLDADDVLLPGDREKLLALKSTLSDSADVVMMRYNTAFDSQGNAIFSYYRERLVRRGRHFLWKEPVHEYIETYGNAVMSEVCVTHTKTHSTSTRRNIAIYEKLLSQGEKLTPRGLYYFARELKENGRYSEAIGCFSRFLNEGRGWTEDNINACAELAVCYQATGNEEKQFRTLLRSFVYDTPRAEICCRIGYLYKKRNDFGKAAFWFRLATTLVPPENNWGFFQKDDWGYVPYMELSVCYDKLGKAELAEEYNELAGACKPGDPAVEYNRSYFRSIRQKKEDVEKNG